MVRHFLSTDSDPYQPHTMQPLRPKGLQLTILYVRFNGATLADCRNEQLLNKVTRLA